jgi:hypothetical protein
MRLVGKELLFVEYFLKYVGHGRQLTILCSSGVLISGKYRDDDESNFIKFKG